MAGDIGVDIRLNVLDTGGKGKPARTTLGDYADWTADKAVDGDDNIRGGQRTCFHGYSSPSDWTVDLGQEYQLYDIRVYIRSTFESRTADSIIYLDNNSSQVCFTFPSVIRNNPTDVTCNGTARYVTIMNTERNTKGQGLLNICEV